jgi:hypothetical protein
MANKAIIPAIEKPMSRFMRASVEKSRLHWVLNWG